MQAVLREFSLLDGFAAAGLFQSLVILVYIAFRVRDWREAAPALAYFFFLAAAFGLKLALRLQDYAAEIRLVYWFAVMMGPPICYLLVMQAARVMDQPRPRDIAVVLTVPAAAVFSALIIGVLPSCEGEGFLSCDKSFEILYWLGGMSGALSMLAIWIRRGVFEKIFTLKADAKDTG